VVEEKNHTNSDFTPCFSGDCPVVLKCTATIDQFPFITVPNSYAHSKPFCIPLIWEDKCAPITLCPGCDIGECDNKESHGHTPY
jgi:hypothetical protein